MPVELIVGRVKSNDAGRGIARIDQEAMRELGIVSGDIIKIEGDQETYAKAWPGYSEDTGRGIIRIDGNTRANANVGIDDRVEVSKAEAKEASKITLATTQNVQIRGGE
ncbi:MAG: AAA family ATPase, partial [Halobacteria archaeon]|nr:AAA family ATPase [Halobacteria archaeon]